MLCARRRSIPYPVSSSWRPPLEPQPLHRRSAAGTPPSARRARAGPAGAAIIVAAAPQVLARTRGVYLKGWTPRADRSAPPLSDSALAGRARNSPESVRKLQQIFGGVMLPWPASRRARTTCGPPRRTARGSRPRGFRPARAAPRWASRCLRPARPDERHFVARLGILRLEHREREHLPF